jgi:glutathione S-transferase
MTAVPRLYQRQGAGRPPRVRWALEEAGAPYEYVVMTKENGLLDEHRSRHPLGRVPVLEVDEGSLIESAAICLHIADLHPEAGLIPAPGTYARGKIYQWSFFAMTEVEPAMLRYYTAREGTDAEAAAKAAARRDKAMNVLAEALDGHEYLVDDTFSIADVVTGGVLDSARTYDLLPETPVLQEYLARLDAREAKQRAYAL